jgi:hypothetical protein
MPHKPEPPPMSTFDGTVEATDERDAIERVARERDIPAAWLIARRR